MALESIEPPVDTPCERIGEFVGIPARETSVEHFALICDAIAINIGQLLYLRGVGEDDATDAVRFWDGGFPAANNRAIRVRQRKPLSS